MQEQKRQIYKGKINKTSPLPLSTYDLNQVFERVVLLLTKMIKNRHSLKEIAYYLSK